MSDFYSEAKTRTARKDHRCTYYGETIPKDDPLYQEGFKAGAASRDAEVNDWRSQAHRSQSEADNAIAECDQLRAELAAALAACKAKDEALTSDVTVTTQSGKVTVPLRTLSFAVNEAIAIQPDDVALKAWLGEPVAWTHSCPVLCLDGVELWIDRCPHCGKPAAAPKGEE